LHQESKDRIINLTDKIERLQIDQDRMATENRVLADEKRNLEARLNHTESELNVCEMTKEHLRNDKTIVSIVFENGDVKLVLFFFKRFNVVVKYNLYICNFYIFTFPNNYFLLGDEKYYESFISFEHHI
jgi:regulator of replication initiation timing